MVCDVFPVKLPGLLAFSSAALCCLLQSHVTSATCNGASHVALLPHEARQIRCSFLLQRIRSVCAGADHGGVISFFNFIFVVVPSAWNSCLIVLVIKRDGGPTSFEHCAYVFPQVDFLQGEFRSGADAMTFNVFLFLWVEAIVPLTEVSGS